MKYARLGNTGLIVSRLCFGAMTFGDHPSIPAMYRVDQTSAKAMVEKSLKAGINFFDTADAYAAGQSEVMLGQLLGRIRQDVIIATKVGMRTGEPVTQTGLSRRHIFASCEASLKRLNTDYIDLYMVHKEDPLTPLEETLEALNDLVRTGKVRYIGFSNWSAWLAATALQIQKAHGWAQFCCGQMNYSLVVRDVEHDVVPFILYSGLGMTVWSPLAGGFLSGKYSRELLDDSDNRLAGLHFLPFDKDLGFRVLERMREIANTGHGSTARIAIAWLLAKPVVSSVITGAGRLHHLEDNLLAAETSLNETEIKELDAMTAPRQLYPHWFNENPPDAQHSAVLG